ncbi:MAG: tRNA-dihydrouridine synthase [Thermoleophilia bacterium]|nr:tRNA-dihydrouridine synthase [Thermoleophilia bacterium]
MADIAVDFAGLVLKNPFIIASSELTNTLEKVKIAEEHGAAAVSTKLAFLHVPFPARPYHIVERNGGFFSPSGERLSVEQAQVLVQQCKEQTELKVIANMMGPGEDLEGWATLGRMLEEAGADMLELNMSCPNVGLMAKQLGVEAPPELGAFLGQNPALAGRVARAVSEAVSIPVMAKMTPEANTRLVSEACATNGAAAVSAINCPQSLPGLDIYRGGRPLYPTVRSQSFAGLCGPWIRPLAYRHVAQIRQALPDFPIAGGGGLMTWRHVVEMVMYGATAVTFCSLLYLKGYKAFAKLEGGLRKFMDEQGYATLADFRGIALPYIVTPDKVDYAGGVPVFDLEKCNGCGLCAAPGHCECIEMRDGLPVLVRPDECYSCAVCYFLCPREAIAMQGGAA